MAFFDKLSKSVTEASQKTIAKTKELADISRLNSTIYEQEKIIENQHIEIGKLYADLHKEDFEEDFAAMISAIAEAEEKINDCKRQIQDIKGVQRCENCGAEVPSGAAFCSACGNTMPKKQPDEVEEGLKCENCGTEVNEGMRFCPACGKAVEVAEVQPEEAAE